MSIKNSLFFCNDKVYVGLDYTAPVMMADVTSHSHTISSGGHSHSVGDPGHSHAANSHGINLMFVYCTTLLRGETSTTGRFARHDASLDEATTEKVKIAAFHHFQSDGLTPMFDWIGEMVNGKWCASYGTGDLLSRFVTFGFERIEDAVMFSLTWAENA